VIAENPAKEHGWHKLTLWLWLMLIEAWPFALLSKHRKDLGAICGSREDVAVLIKTSTNLQANNKMATAVVLKVGGL
jgi:hypothetical protein